MVENRWIVVYDNYGGYEEKAVNRIASAVMAHTNYVLPTFSAAAATDQLIAANNVIFVGTDKHKHLAYLMEKGLIPAATGAEGYAIKVADNYLSPDKQMIAVLGYDPVGVMYGAADFENKYLGAGMYDHDNYQITTKKFLDVPFAERMPEYELVESPSYKMRGIWTWGHCIYDYRAFFNNMASLKLNHIVIWNDFAPVNAKAVVDYAHSLNIQVFWGFSWGWGVGVLDLENNRLDDEKFIAKWSAHVREGYETQYAHSGADGIYFQSFTETKAKNIGDICIAEAVTKWVNTISNDLFTAHPDLKIQFGLHATSVNDRLKYLKQIDKRVYIVWEDCGSFPYNYHPKKVQDFAETTAFNDSIYHLRGADDKSGAVMKGMTTLDWSTFENQQGSFVLGECSKSFVAERSANSQRIWKYIQGYWLKNARYAAATFDQVCTLTGGNALMQLLVEDGCFEDEIFFPAAVAAEMMWNTKDSAENVLGKVAHFPRVKFANLA